MHLGITVYMTGPEKSLHVQNTEGVHLSLSPKLGTVPNCAFREGVHLESVHLERFVCSWFMLKFGQFHVNIYFGGNSEQFEVLL